MSNVVCETSELEALILNEHQNTDNCEITSSLQLTESEERSDIFFSSADSEVGTHDIQKLLLETKKSRKPNSDMPLPEGKDAHFFISYSNDDYETVLPLILELEQTHNVACIFHARDFISGTEIRRNIERSMEKSMKVLLFLSNQFLQSNYCKHENELAFAMSMTTGNKIIIPIKLDECDVPSSLKTLTYIDIDTDNLAERIIEAYNCTKTECLPDDFECARKFENGCSVILPRAFDPNKYRMIENTKVVIDDETRQMLNTGKFQVSEETVQAAADIANKYLPPDRWARSQPGNLFCFCFSASIVTVSVIMLMYATSQLAFSKRYFSQLSEDAKQRIDGMTIISSICIPILLALGMWNYYSKQKTLDQGKLMVALFKEFTVKTYRAGVFFKICEGTAYIPTVEIIRYNIRPCQMYLARKIKQYVDENNDRADVFSMDEYEKRADLFIRNTLTTYIYNTVSDAPVIRHKVKGGRSCLCQVLEPYVGEYVLAWLSRESALQIEEV